MTEITFKTKYDLGAIGTGHKKLTVTSWNGGDYKFDIRDWYDNGNAGKGIALTKGELKALFDLLEAMETTDELSNILSSDEPTETTETTEESSETYPDDIDSKFKELDKLFKDFKVEKKYGIMEFAKESGNRLQYYVTKDSKQFPEYEDLVKKLELKSFVTDKGNLYIYTL